MTAAAMAGKSPRAARIARARLGFRALGLEDADRRAVQHRLTGKASLGEMSMAQLGAVLDHLRRQGAFARPAGGRGPARAGRRPLADTPHARKCRALWLSLYQLGEVQDPSETALAHFVERQIGVADLRFVAPEDGHKAIEALKDWCGRAGWTVPKGGDTAKRSLLRHLWRRLAELHAAPEASLDGWISGALGTRCRPLGLLEPAELDAAIERLGPLYRAAKKSTSDGASAPLQEAG
jgi:phage gp16-like protein